MIAGLFIAACAVVVGVLLLACRRVRDEPVAEHPRDANRAFLGALVVIGISSALAVNGLIGLTVLLLTATPQLLDVAPIWLLASAFGSCVVVLLAFATLLMLGGARRAYPVLLEMATVGFLGATTTAFVELREYNMSADTAPSRFEVGAVGHARESALSSIGIRRYSVWTRVTDQKGFLIERTLTVPARSGTRMERAVALCIEQRTGVLGARWVGAVTVIEKPDADPHVATSANGSRDVSRIGWGPCRPS